jgi:hypothetical protein
MDSKKTPVRVQSGGTQISRRTVARGAAWAAPIAAVGVAAPAFAASCEPTITFGSDSCKCPGQSSEPWTYYLQFCITGSNRCGFPVGTPFTVTKVVTNKELADGHNQCFPIQLGQTAGTIGGACTQTIRLTSTNSANLLDVTFIVNPGQPNAQTFTTFKIPAPPDCATISEIAAKRCDGCTP